MIKKNRKKLIAAAIVPLVLLISFYIWANGPSVAVIGPPLKAVKGDSTDTSVTSVAYDQVILQVPSRFVPKQKTLGSGNPIHVQQLFATPISGTQGLFGDQLAVTVATTPAGGLSEVSAVQLRRRDANYNLVSESASYIVFEKLSGYEVGAFASNGATYVSMVISGSPSPQSGQQLKTELQTMIESLTWR